MLPDYYAILGVSTQATASAIKQAYRTRARVAHPDHGGSHEAMLEINEAYEILNNPLAREHYDAARASQFDVAAHYYAQEDASKARQRAQEYPRTWTDFETRLAKDFTEAKHGRDGRFATVNNSVSGRWFIGIGTIIGLGLGIASLLCFKAGNLVTVVTFAAGGGCAAQWLHKQIGNSIRPSSTPTRSASQNTASTATIQPPNTPSKENDKAAGLAVIVGIVAFIILACVCQNREGEGFFGPPDVSINWLAVLFGTGICTFIGYHAGRKL